MILRQSCAYVWVEVWLRIDPTSLIPESRIETTEDRLNNDLNDWVIGYNDKRQNSLLTLLSTTNTP